MHQDPRAMIRERITAIIKDKAKRRRAIAVIILIAAAGFAFSLFRGYEDGKVLKVSGNIEGNEVRISFRVTGQILELVADEGSVIKKDDVLARLNKDELTKDRDQTEATLNKANSQYALDKLEYERAEKLFAEGAISTQERDVAKTKMDTEKANGEQLRAALDLANTKLGWADLASPLNGYITVKSALQGEVVQQGAPVFTAVDMDDVWVTGYVNEKDLGRIKLGQKVAVKIDAYPKKKYDGKVSFISQQTEFTPKYIQTTEERVKYVYRIKVRADNSSRDLKPGMPADAYIMLEEK